MWVYTISGNLESLAEGLAEAEGTATAGTPAFVADLLWEAGAQGLEERGPSETPSVRAYFGEATPELRAALKPLGGEWSEEPERDWQAEWKRGIAPVQAGRLTITPTWLAGEVQGPKLLIDPGMAFGSGHHDTTRMAVTALGELKLAGKVVLDVGSGSGVLAIAALLLGARAATGLDNDPLTLETARQNALLNGVEAQFLEGSLPHEGLHCDVLVANLYAELHDLLMEEYSALLPSGGGLLLTGIMESKEGLVIGALERAGFGLLHTERTSGPEGSEGWVLLRAVKP